MRGKTGLIERAMRDVDRLTRTPEGMTHEADDDRGPLGAAKRAQWQSARAAVVKGENEMRRRLGKGPLPKDPLISNDGEDE